MTLAYIALGSNLGDRSAALDAAIAALRSTPGLTVLAVSPYLETAPAGGPPNQPPFLNAAAAIETDLDPETLLDLFQDIERRLGRERIVRWSPRTIDLDLLLYGSRIVVTGRLRIPHLRLRERRFVLEPLAAIAPDALDPITGLTIRQLLDTM